LFHPQDRASPAREGADSFARLLDHPSGLAGPARTVPQRRQRAAVTRTATTTEWEICELTMPSSGASGRRRQVIATSKAGPSRWSP
jgi:hypothetical protein